MSAPAREVHNGLSVTAGAWPVCAAIGMATSGAVLSTPLFPVYAARWHLSALLVTSVYAAYIVGTLGALVCFGRASDRYGRRPVLFAGLVCAAVGVLVLLFAPGVVWLFPGRVLQGLTVGLVSAAGSAALADRTATPASAAMLATASNVGGMAVGTLAAGLLAQYLPWPLRLSYVVYLVLLAGVAVAVLRLPEPRRRAAVPNAGTDRPPGRDAVPVPAFAAAAASTLVGFASLALLLSLGPRLALEFTGSHNLALGGLVTCLSCLAAAITQLLARSVRPRLASHTGLGVILLGLGALLGAGMSRLLVPLLAAGGLIGVGYGLVFLGGLSGVQRIIPPQRRATWLSGYFVTAYLGMSVPAIGLGLLTDRLGLLPAMVVFAGYAAVLSVLIGLACHAQPRLDGG